MPGIGKSSLLNQFCKQEHATFLFATSKCEEHNTEPFHAWKQIIQQLTNSCLFQKDLHHIKQELTSAVHGLGQLLVQLVPDVQHLLLSVNNIPEAYGIETIDRFFHTLMVFFQTICKCCKPLCLILDDLQVNINN